jgi:glyoxylate/hydroxypyruvate reductase
MQRLSQLALHLAQIQGGSSLNRSQFTPHRRDPATTNTMAKTKVVVTRQLIDEAQALLDAKKDELEIVQWKSEKARHPEDN